MESKKKGSKCLKLIIKRPKQKLFSPKMVTFFINIKNQNININTLNVKRLGCVG